MLFTKVLKNLIFSRNKARLLLILFPTIFSLFKRDLNLFKEYLDNSKKSDSWSIIGLLLVTIIQKILIVLVLYLFLSDVFTRFPIT